MERYGYGESEETSDSTVIRMRLCDLDTDSEVVPAISNIDAQYVLLLECDNAIYGFDESQWESINSIDDDTPGFEVVLSEDDMRLYRIDKASCN